MIDKWQAIQDPSTKGVGGLEGLKGLNITEEPDYNNVPRYTLDQMRNINIFGRDISPLKEEVGTEEFGQSMYDKRATLLADIKDLNEFRAQEQSAMAKIGAGIVKGTILAGTTFADGVAGTVVGAMNVLTNLPEITDSDSFGEGMKKAGEAFIFNAFSKTMQEINDKAESLIPNYYTRAEKEDPWYEHMFSANFLGDKFLKNLGFMIGAAYAGKVNAGILSKAMGLNEVRNAFKGAVTTVDGAILNSPQEIVQAYAEGRALMNGEKLTADLAKQAKRLKNAELTLKIAGSTSAAMGEGRIEAISNTNDYIKMHEGLLQQAHNDRMVDIEHKLAMEHPEWFSFVPRPDGMGMMKTLTSEEGLVEWNRLAQEEDARYAAAQEKLYQDAATMANEIFLANTLLLSVDNFIQSGRFFTGGYSQGRNALNLLRKNAETGVYETNRGALVRQGIKAGISPLVEAQEEMSQAAISTGAGLKQAARLNEFYGYAIDPDATSDLVNWYNAAAEGIKQTYGNGNAWEEGFIGFLTGMLGMPSFSLEKSETGKKKLKLNFQGELWEGIKEAKQLSADQTEMLGIINNAIQSEEYKNYFQGKVRDSVIKNRKGEALAKGDAYEYKNAELSEVVNWAIMFDKAGRMEDFYDNIESLANISEEDVATIRSMTVREDGTSVYDGKTDEEVVADFKKEAEQIKKQADRYVQISHDLKTLYGESIQPEVLEEMTYNLMHISDWEDRFSDLLQSVREDASLQALEKSKRLFGHNQSAKERIEAQRNALLDDGMSALDILTTLTTKEWDKVVQDNANYVRNHNGSLKDVTKLLNSFEDLNKMFLARREFINRYNTLMNHPELFAQENQKVIEQFMKDQKQKLLDGLVEDAKKPENVSSYETFKHYILKNVDEDSIDTALEAFASSDNSDLKKYAAQYKSIRDVAAALEPIVSDLPADLDGNSVRAGIANILSHSNTIEEIAAGIDSAIIMLKEDGQAKQAELYEQVKKDLQQALKSKTATSAKKTETPAEKKPKSVKDKIKNEVEKAVQKVKSNVAKWGIPTASSEEGSENSEENNANSGETVDENLFENLDTLDDGELRRIVNGNHPLVKGIKSNSDRKALIALAKKILEDKRKELPNVVITEEIVETNADDSSGTGATDEQEKYEQALRSWKVSKYYLQSIKGNNAELLSVGQGNVSEEDVQLMEALDNVGAYEFVDKGYLGIIVQKLGASNVPIHYIIKNDDSFGNTILLGIEITDEVRKLIEDGKIKVTPVTASDTKQYQIVGSLGFNGKSPSAQSASREIVRQVNKDSAFLRKPENKDNGVYFVNPNIKNYIKHIYSGRMVLTDDNNLIRKDHDVTKEYFEDGAVLGVYYNESMHAPIDKESETIVELNKHNLSDKEGSVWLLTQEADGRWYSKGIQVKRFGDNWTIDDNLDTPMGEYLMSAARTLVDPSKSIVQRASAKYALGEVLYIPDNVKILFNEGAVSIKIDGETISTIEASDNSEEDAKEFLRALQDDSLNLRFQVDTSKISDGNQEYLDFIVESGILHTNLPIGPNGTKNVAGSFDLYLNEEEAKKELNTEKVITGHTGDTTVTNTKKPVLSVHVNGVKYSQNSEGVWFEGEISEGNKVDNSEFLDAILKIKDGTLSPIGDSNLYPLSNGSAIKEVNGGYKLLSKFEVSQELEGAKDRKAKAKKIKALKENSGEFKLERKYDITEGGTPGAEPVSLSDFMEEEEEVEDVESNAVDGSIGEEPKGGALTFDEQQAMSEQELRDLSKLNFMSSRAARRLLKENGVTRQDLENELGKEAVEGIKTEAELDAVIDNYLHCRKPK